MLDPPVPVLARWSPLPERVTIDFSHFIQSAAALNLANWFVRIGNFERDLDAAVALVGTVQLLTSMGALNAGPDVVSFSPPPFDVISRTAKPTPAAAFTDFPVV